MGARSATARPTRSRSPGAFRPRSTPGPRCTPRSRRATCAPAPSSSTGSRVLSSARTGRSSGRGLPALARRGGGQSRRGRVRRSHARLHRRLSRGLERGHREGLRAGRVEARRLEEPSHLLAEMAHTRTAPRASGTGKPPDSCSAAHGRMAPRRHSSAVEQLFRKQQVLGSNPSVGSTPLPLVVHPTGHPDGLWSESSSLLTSRRRLGIGTDPAIGSAQPFVGSVLNPLAPTISNAHVASLPPALQCA